MSSARSPFRLFVFSLLLLTVCATPLFAQDAPKLPDGMLGEWAIDVDTMLANDPRFAQMPEEQRKQQANMMRAMLGSGRITISQTAFNMNIMGRPQNAKLEVKKVDGNVAVFVATPDDGQEAKELTATLNADGTMQVTDGDQPMWFKRAEPETGPAPAEALIGDWELDIKATIAEFKKAHPELTEADLKQAADEISAEAPSKVSFAKGTMTVTKGDAEEAGTWEVTASTGSQVELKLTAAGGDAEPALLTLKGKDAFLFHAPGDDPSLFYRRVKKETAPSGKPGDIIGMWDVDVEATIKADPENANMTDEELEMTMAIAGPMLSSMKFEFTADTMFMVMAGQRIPIGSWKITEQQGTSLTVDVTDLEGTTTSSKWLHVGNRLMITVNDSPMHLKREGGDTTEPGSGGAETTPTTPPVTGPAAGLIGKWMIDAEATVRAESDGMTEEDIQAAIEATRAAVASVIYEFTADSLKIHSAGAVVPIGTYKVKSAEGETIVIDYTGMDGETETVTLTLKGDSLSGAIGGEGSYLTRKK